MKWTRNAIIGRMIGMLSLFLSITQNWIQNPMNYAVSEITDTVAYFEKNADKYNADVTRFQLSVIAQADF